MRRALVVLVCLLALPATAGAHSFVRPGGAVVSYISADATSLNDLVVRQDGSQIEFRDASVDGGIDPGSCTPGDISGQGFIIQVFCPAAPVERVRIDLGDREDKANVSVGVPVTLLGGTGSDTLTTGPENDEIVGGDGADTIDAGAGDDKIGARDGAVDTIVCGPGNDVVDLDLLDVADPSCEGVARVDTTPPPGPPDEPGPPGLVVGAAVVQRATLGGVVRVYATATEPARIGASGFLDAAGLQLPIQRLPEQDVAIGGGGAVLEFVLQGRPWRVASRSLARKKPVRVRLGVVATDRGGESTRRDAPRIQLLPSRHRIFHHPEPGDSDGDNVRDENDNCPTTANGAQTNTDHDAQGDNCDADDDNDGIPDSADNCRIDVNPGQEDTDGDGYGDACPPVDTDGDGLINADDNCDTTVNAGQEDFDGDDKGDACDLDYDGDGIDDQYDNCPTVYNLEPTDTDGDGYVNDQADGDGDGIGTACDPDESTVQPPPPTPTPAPTATVAATLEATAATPGRQRVPVIGAGPIVTVDCTLACSATATVTVTAGTARRLDIPTKLGSGAAQLDGAGTTYAFPRLRKRARRGLAGAVHATLTTTVTAAGGGAPVVLSQPLTLKS